MNQPAIGFPRQSSYVMQIPEGVAGVRATLKWMGHLVKRGKVNDLIRNYTNALISNIPQKDYRREIATVFDFVQNKIRYVRDPRKVETIHDADVILTQGWGDCDDKAILLATMLETIGKPTRFVPVGFRPGQISHVYTEVVWGPRATDWIALEPTEPYPLGWRVPGIAAALEPWYN